MCVLVVHANHIRKELKMKNDISVIILTYNEELHIERCIKSLQSFVNEIFVVDSYSTDRTVEIAESLGAKVYQNKWVNYAVQFQWALDNCDITTKWTMRIDADIYAEQKLIDEINNRLNLLDQDITAIKFNVKVLFFDKWIRFGAFYPIEVVWLWKTGLGRIESRWMDEHMIISNGKTIAFHSGDLIDHNLNSISWWITKHNNYATREMIDLMNHKYKFITNTDEYKDVNNKKAKLKRFVKEKLYSKLPFGVRPFLYFVYRYFIRLGFLDGFRGFVWHFMQGWWYRMLVDVKCYEFERKLKEYDDIKLMIKKEYGLDV
jgi:glycosyltransferase involved in cell wall biosynthesis